MPGTLAYCRTLIDRQQFHAVIEQLDDEWAGSPSPALLMVKALVHTHLGQPGLAEGAYSQAIAAEDQLDMDARVDWAAVLLMRQQPAEARALLDEVLTQRPDHALALARAGNCAMAGENWQQAADYFQRSLAVSPNRIRVWNNLALVRLQQQQWSEAQQAIDSGWRYLSAALDSSSATTTAAEKASALTMPVSPAPANTLRALPDTVLAQQQGLLTLSQLQLWVASEQFAAAEAWLCDLTQAQQRGEIEEQQLMHWLTEYGQFLSWYEHHDQAEECLRDYLGRFPRSRALLVKLAELALLKGRFTPAMTLLRRAIQCTTANAVAGIAPEAGAENTPDTRADTISLWLKLSGACLHRFPQQARAAAEKATELIDQVEHHQAPPATGEWQSQPELLKQLKARAANAMAQLALSEQKFTAAEQGFNTIIAQHPGFVPALQGLGQVYMQQGKIDEAVAIYETVKTLDPVNGVSALIQARRFPDDVAALEKLEKVARQPSLEGKAKAGLLFQLAAAWEGRRDYDKAFELANQANVASRKFLPYDRQKHRNQSARIRFAFNKALFDHRADCGVDSTLPVFVVGMPRSGTTLVEQILAGHSEIFGAGELGVMPRVIQGLNRWERHTGSGRQYPDCVDDLNPQVANGIANKVLAELREYDPDAKHIVDKLPHNFECIGLIKLLFPKARIISVRRDPRDIALSNYFTDYQAKYGGMGFAYDLTDIGEQLADHNLMMHHWQQIFPGEILDIQYQQLVQDLEGTARKMLDYIGVDWQPAVLNFNELDRAIRTASVWQVRQPIYTSSLAKWARYEKYLAPLIQGTNAKIVSEPITDMIALPAPGLLTDGVALFNNNELDAAERSFKTMLHHNPDHAAAQYMVGLIYCRKGHLADGITCIESALEKCPWKNDWRESLAEAYGAVGDHEKVIELQQAQPGKSLVEEAAQEHVQEDALYSTEWQHATPLTSSHVAVAGGAASRDRAKIL